MQDLGGDRPRGGVAGTVRTVDAHDRVEVDQAAPLVLGDLRVGQPGDTAEAARRHAEEAGQRPPEGDHEAVPELPGVRLPQDRADVVVGVRVGRCAEPGVVGMVVAVAAARVTWPDLVVRRVCTGPNPGAVSVRNARGLSVTSGTSLFPPASPARSRWNASPA